MTNGNVVEFVLERAPDKSAWLVWDSRSGAWAPVAKKQADAIARARELAKEVSTAGGHSRLRILGKDREVRYEWNYGPGARGRTADRPKEGSAGKLPTPFAKTRMGRRPRQLTTNSR